MAEADSVWTRQRRKRREQPALTQEQVVAEAIKLLDAEGPEALSMRRLGAQLGAVATAIYWHVASKDELLELVANEVYGELEIPPVSRPQEWREAAKGAAISLREMILRHPWIAALLADVGLSYLGPNVMRASEQMQALYETAGFDMLEADMAGKAVIAYVLGFAGTEAATIRKVAKSEKSADELLAELWPAAEQAAQNHPRLRKLYAAYKGMDQAANSDETFTYGLERVLDGLEARLAN